METATVETTIDRPADAVWSVVGDFGGLDRWMPGVESCTLDGDVRTIATMGMEIGERLLRRDDAARELTYSIVSGPAPVESHEATITVHPDGAGCRVTWAVSVEPEGAAFFADVYGRSLEALKAHTEI